MAQKINIVLFGIGKAGSAFINKVSKNRKDLIIDNHLDLRFPVITSSTTAFFEKEGINYSWEANFIQFAIPFRLEDVLLYVMENNLQNAIVVDATHSTALASEYPDLIKSGFNLVSINHSTVASNAGYEKRLHFLAESRGLVFRYLQLKEGGKEAAACALYSAVLSIAERRKVLISQT